LQDNEDKIQAARQAAVEDEIRHIEQDLEPRALELAGQWLKQEDRLRQQELQASEIERRREEGVLQGRLQDFTRKLEEGRKRREDARRRAEEERLRAEEERKRLEQEKLPKPEPLKEQPQPSAKKAAQEDAIWGSVEQAAEEVHVEAPKATDAPRPTDALLNRAREFFSQGDVENAAAVIARALELDPSHEAALKFQKEIAPGRAAATEAAPVEAAAQEETEAPPKAKPKLSKKTVTRLVWIAGGAILLGVAVVLFFRFKSTLFPRNVSIAVMPFTDGSAASAGSAIGSSLAQEIVSRLEHLKSVSVMGFSSSQAVARSASDAPHAVFDLGYPVILEGKIRMGEGSYVVDVKISDSVGATQWSHSYEKTADQLAQLPSEIVAQIVDSYGLALDAQSKTFLSAEVTSNGNAYTAYLQGLALLQHHDADSAQRALELFQQAIDQDKEFMGVLAEASLAVIAKAEYSGNADESTLAHAEQLARACMTADASVVEAHVALGKIFGLRKQYDAALKEFDGALEQSPNNTEALAAKARIYLEIGKYDDATDALTRATELNPRDPAILELFAFANQLKNDPREASRYHEIALPVSEDSTRYLTGPMADAILFDPDMILSYGGRVAAALEHNITSDPTDYVDMYRLGRLLQVSGKVPEASEMLGRLSELLRRDLRVHPQNANAMVCLGLALTRLGKFPEAADLAKKALVVGKSDPGIPYKVAQIYALQKNPEALQILHDAVAGQFRLAELTNGDFYNFRDNQDFYSTIQLSSK
jgi:tetratricopeptide (TPR) repeat protein